MASSSSTTRYYRRRYTKEEIARMTHCECKYPIYEQVAWTPENPGRRFKSCPTRNKGKKCEVYGFLDDELPSQYYKDLMFKLHKDNEMLECNLECLTKQVHPQTGNVIHHTQELKPMQAEKPTGNEDVCMAVIYKDLNELKIKGKMNDIFLVGSTCLIMVLLVLLTAVIVGSFRK